MEEVLCALLTEHRAAVDLGDGSADTVMVPPATPATA
jgi:hypothetical protein